MIGAVVLMVAGSLLMSLAQYLFKVSADQAPKTFSLKILLNFKVWLGMIFYLILFGLMIVAFKHGDLLVLAPIANLALVWNLFLGKWFLREELTLQKVTATLMIVFGSVVLFF